MSEEAKDLCRGPRALKEGESLAIYRTATKEGKPGGQLVFMREYGRLMCLVAEPPVEMGQTHEAARRQVVWQYDANEEELAQMLYERVVDHSRPFVVFSTKWDSFFILREQEDVRK